jgi:hypothetical protein
VVGERGHLQHAGRAEERVADLVEEGSGAVAGGDRRGVVEPPGAGGGADGEAQVAAAAGEVEDELGLVAAVDTEAVLPP